MSSENSRYAGVQGVADVEAYDPTKNYEIYDPKPITKTVTEERIPTTVAEMITDKMGEDFENDQERELDVYTKAQEMGTTDLDLAELRLVNDKMRPPRTGIVANQAAIDRQNNESQASPVADTDPFSKEKLTAKTSFIGSEDVARQYPDMDEKQALNMTAELNRIIGDASNKRNENQNQDTVPTPKTKIDINVEDDQTDEKEVDIPVHTPEQSTPGIENTPSAEPVEANNVDAHISRRLDNMVNQIKKDGKISYKNPDGTSETKISYDEKTGKFLLSRVKNIHDVGGGYRNETDISPISLNDNDVKEFVNEDLQNIARYFEEKETETQTPVVENLINTGVDEEKFEFDEERGFVRPLDTKKSSDSVPQTSSGAFSETVISDPINAHFQTIREEGGKANLVTESSDGSSLVTEIKGGSEEVDRIKRDNPRVQAREANDSVTTRPEFPTRLAYVESKITDPNLSEELQEKYRKEAEEFKSNLPSDTAPLLDKSQANSTPSVFDQMKKDPRYGFPKTDVNSVPSFLENRGEVSQFDDTSDDKLPDWLTADPEEDLEIEEGDDFKFVDDDEIDFSDDSDEYSEESSAVDLSIPEKERFARYNQEIENETDFLWEDEQKHDFEKLQEKFNGESSGFFKSVGTKMRSMFRR